jgi:ATP-dependent DNA ligase
MPSTCSNSTARTYGASRSRPAKATLASLLRGCGVGLRLVEHLEHGGDVVYRHACKLGCEGIVSKRLGSPYVSGRTRHWLKFKNPAAPAVKREAEEEWG